MDLSLSLASSRANASLCSGHESSLPNGRLRLPDSATDSMMVWLSVRCDRIVLLLTICSARKRGLCMSSNSSSSVAQIPGYKDHKHCSVRCCGSKHLGSPRIRQGTHRYGEKHREASESLLIDLSTKYRPRIAPIIKIAAIITLTVATNLLELFSSK